MTSRVAGVLFAASCLAACGSSKSTIDGSHPLTPDANVDAAVIGPDATPACAAATTHSDLTWIQANVFGPSCANFSACHMGNAAEAGHLNLETGMSHDQLVNHDTTLYPGPWQRVVPSDEAHSYLSVIIGDETGPITQSVGTMPYNSPLLCKEKRDAIERWITAGALDN